MYVYTYTHTCIYMPCVYDIYISHTYTHTHIHTHTHTHTHTYTQVIDLLTRKTLRTETMTAGIESMAISNRSSIVQIIIYLEIIVYLGKYYLQGTLLTPAIFNSAQHLVCALVDGSGVVLEVHNILTLNPKP